MKYNRNEMAAGSRNILMITCARSHESRCTSEAYQLLDGLFEMDDYIPSLIQGGGQGGGRLSSEEQMLEEIKFIKRLTQLFQGPKAIVHSSDIKTIAVVMPVAHKNTCVTSFLLGFGNIPVYKIFTVLIMHTTIRL